MSISGIGSARGFDLSKISSRIMKELDTNGDKSVDKEEFVSGLTKKGVSASEAEKRFDSIDTKGAGKLTQSDIEASIKSLGNKGTHPGGPPPGGGLPPSGGGKADGEAKSGGSTSSSSATYYDKKDANKDGSVSAEEKMTYDLKHPDIANSGEQNVGNNVDVTA